MIQGKMTCFTTAVFLIRYFNAGASQQFLMDNLPMRPEVFVTYFVHDERKGGGDYVTVTGTVKKVDEFQRLLILTDGTKIPLDEIYDISGELFHNLK